MTRHGSAFIRHVVHFAILGIVYAVMVIAGIATLCATDVMHCVVADNIGLARAALPLLGVTLGLVLVGILVALAARVDATWLREESSWISWQSTLAWGGLCGVAPKLLWDAWSGGYLPDYPHPEWGVLALAGVTVAVVGRIAAARRRRHGERIVPIDR